MEFGQRALGNARSPSPRWQGRGELGHQVSGGLPALRSCDPGRRVADYFTCDPGTRVPFMEKLLPFRQEKRSEVPSVVHADGTGRLQTVTPKSSPRFYALLQAFDARTGVPVVLNTSFNLNGEPIVCAPDAIRSFYTCALDVLTWGTSASRTDSCIRKARRPQGTR